VELEHRAPVAVLLTGSGSDPLPARVDTDDGTVLTVVLVLRPEQRAFPVPVRRCSVEWTTRNGLHRVSGTVSSVDPRPEVLHVVRDDGSEQVEQRREAVRVEVVVEAAFTVVGAEDRAETNTLDVSSAGLCIRDPLDLDVNVVIDVELRIAPAPVRARAVVVRARRPGEKGVRIEEIGPDDHHRLARFVVERQRLELKVARERLR
jgi:hypothetical protein